MSPPAPPAAPRRPVTLERFGTSWTDDYAWLRDPAYPEVNDPAIRDYLEAENAYFRAVIAPVRTGDRTPARRAQGAHQARRQLGPGARGWLRVSLAVRGRRAVPGLVPTGRGWPRCDPDPRRGRAGRGQELLQPARVRGQPRRRAARLHDRRGRLGTLPAALEGPGDRSGTRRSGRQHLGCGRMGRGRADAALCRAERPAAARSAYAPTGWATIRPGTRSSTRRPTRPSSFRSARPAAAAGCWSRPGLTSRARSACSTPPTHWRRRGWWRRGARATATASTMRTAGSGS